MAQIFLDKSGRRNLGETLPIPTTWFWSTELVRIRCSLRLRGTLAGVLPVTFPLQRTLAEAPPATLPLMWERNLLHLKTLCVSDRHFTVRIREVLKSVSHVVKDICQEFFNAMHWPGFNFYIPLSRVVPVWWHLWCQGWHEWWSLSVSFGDLKMLKCFDLWCSGAVSRWSTLPAVNRTQLAPPLTPLLIS